MLGMSSEDGKKPCRVHVAWSRRRSLGDLENKRKFLRHCDMESLKTSSNSRANRLFFPELSWPGREGSNPTIIRCHTRIFPFRPARLIPSLIPKALVGMTDDEVAYIEAKGWKASAVPELSTSTTSRTSVDQTLEL
jgi:hypothetical protein